VRRRWVAFVAVVAFIGAAILGAVGDWVWWEPYKGVVITLAAGGSLLVAIVLAMLLRTRPAALVVSAIGVGLIAGRSLGPSRPQLEQFEGTLTVTLMAPRATTGSAPVSCASDAVATELSLSGDPNLRLDVVPDDPAAPADVDQREFVGVSLTVGDRWAQVPTPRPGGVVLWISVGRVEADLPETRMRSGPSSTLEMDRSATGGTLSFAGLVPDMRPGEATGDPIDLAGTMTWTCR
jgi:hypothetical protein